ncbi:hypothetical protein [Massilia sp. S19_KUP03_FR1]|uniref:hypothetical protein n=1 Tax=Massilia sp. S19_KUP03_FR1 TaxID=3025503 RepID=UPI002FCDC26F
MNQLTLVLPFALPPPELAADLVRALQAPALAALLSRPATHASTTFDDDARALPHELWLARELALSNAHAAFAAAAMRGFGLDASAGGWLILHPAHIEIARSHLALHDLRKLQLQDIDARTLFDCALPLFTELGHTLLYGDAQTWFLRAAGWDQLDTSSPDAVLGMNLGDAMPAGAEARAFRRLQNEVQMLWFEHPVNTARAQRGLAPVNAIWPWGGGSAQANKAMTVCGVPGWLQAMAQQVLTDPGAILAGDDNALLVCGALTGPGLAGEWSSWLDAMHQLENTLFAPTLALLAAAKVKSVRLVLSRRTALFDLTTTPMAQRKFWRRITLDSLI